MRARLVVTALVLSLAAVGCNGDDGDDGAAGTSTSSTAAGSSTSGVTSSINAQQAADELKAQEIVLKQSDFPAGFTAIPDTGETDEEEDKAGEEFEACLGISIDDDDRAEAESPDFEAGQFTQVSSSAAFAPTVEDAQKEFAVLRGPKVNQCIQDQFDKELKAQATDVQFAPTKAQTVQFPTLGDGTTAIRLSTAVAGAQGQEVPIYADFVFVVKGRAELTLTFINAGEPFPADLASDLAGKMAGRA